MVLALPLAEANISSVVTFVYLCVYTEGLIYMLISKYNRNTIETGSGDKPEGGKLTMVSRGLRVKAETCMEMMSL